MQNKPFYTSSNFWTFLALTVGALFIGFPEGAAKETVSGIFAIIASFRGIREWVKNNPKFKPIEEINQSNFWAYLATTLTAIIPLLPIEIFDYLQSAIAAAIGGNWQGVFTAIIGIATIVYNLIRNRNRREIQASAAGQTA